VCFTSVRERLSLGPARMSGVGNGRQISASNCSCTEGDKVGTAVATLSKEGSGPRWSSKTSAPTA
jgi:hypothetical protein